MCPAAFWTCVNHLNRWRIPRVMTFFKKILLLFRVRRGHNINKVHSGAADKNHNKHKNMVLLYFIIFVALLLIYWWKHFARKPHPRFPSGPIGLPILGYVPILRAKNILEGLDTLHDKYGEVISLNLGP